MSWSARSMRNDVGDRRALDADAGGGDQRQALDALVSTGSPFRARASRPWNGRRRARPSGSVRRAGRDRNRRGPRHRRASRASDERPKLGWSGTSRSKRSASLSKNGTQPGTPPAPCRNSTAGPLPARRSSSLQLRTSSVVSVGVIETPGSKELREPRHGRACPGHPRLALLQTKKDVDARHKAGHDDVDRFAFEPFASLVRDHGQQQMRGVLRIVIDPMQHGLAAADVVGDVFHVGGAADAGARRRGW